MDPITPFGRKWEFRHSMWIIWLLGPFLLTGFISFLYIGIRMNKKKWKIAAAIYFLIMAQYFFYFGDYDSTSFPFQMSIIVVCVGWIAAWVHAFQARREYLRILAINIINDPNRKTPPFKVKTNYPFPGLTVNQEYCDIKQVKKNKSDAPVVRQKEPFMLDVNKANLEEIASHPYIGSITARQIVQARHKIGEFHSLEHLLQETNMKPHIIAKAKPYIIVNDVVKPSANTFETNNSNQYQSDSSKKENPISGRIVDY